jgi:zinc/manganese transport system ATP-binding protein
MASALSIQHLGIRLGGNQILHDVSAEIHEGEFIGIFGPNGAGKTTLLRALLGLCPVSSGKIRIFGEPPGNANRSIGYMPQSSACPEGTALSARALVSAVRGGEKWGIPWPSLSAAREVSCALELAGVVSYADRPFSVLSGGEKKRVTLAQALIDKPRLLILDEPLASLDPKNQMLLVERIAKIRDQTGATVLFIAHDINPLLGVMNRVLYMAGGSAALGTVDKVITGPSLSSLYGMEIDVVRAGNRIFIVNAESNVTEAALHG